MLFLSLMYCFYCKLIDLGYRVLLFFEQFVVNSTAQQPEAGCGIHKAATN